MFNNYRELMDPETHDLLCQAVERECREVEYPDDLRDVCECPYCGGTLNRGNCYYCDAPFA